MVSDNTKITFMFVTPAVLILLVSVVTPGLVRAEDVNIEDTDYTVREPIRIDGNDDFAAQVAAEGWPGDGSEGDPYVIEGYEINGTGYGYGIYIGNTTVHFVVRGCYVHNASGIEWSAYGGILNTGIILFNVQNGLLSNNTVVGCTEYNSAGIRLHSSEINHVVNNGLIDNTRGISLTVSSNNFITQNIITHEKGYAIASIVLSSSSNYNKINNNTISDYPVGIAIDTSFDYVIKNNTFINVEEEIVIDIEVNGPPPNNNGDETPAIGLPFFVIMILAAIMVIWLKKDKRRGG